MREEQECLADLEEVRRRPERVDCRWNGVGE